MSNKNTPAFPVGGYYQVEGMTLRDYFAAKVMQGELASQDERHNGKGTGLVLEKNFRDFALRCYVLADAMIKAREAQS